MGKLFKRESLSQYRMVWNNVKDVFHLFTHSYQVLPAVTPELMNHAFRVRHKVYCSELNYEETNGLGIERDSYDSHSSQVVVYSRPAKAYIGCLRLVHGYHEDGQKTLPFEEHCKGKLDNKIMTMVRNSGHKYAEVSRLAIDKDFRHIGSNQVAKALGKQKKSSCILLSLYLGLQAMAQQQGVRYLFAIVEPRLLKNLHRHSIPAVQIGEGVDHRGLRVPIMIDVEDIEKIIPAMLRPLYKNIQNSISNHLEASDDWAWVNRDKAVEALQGDRSTNGALA